MCFIKNTIKSSAFFSLFFLLFFNIWYLSGVVVRLLVCQLKIQCHFVHIIMQLENLTLLCKEQFWLQAWTLSSLHFWPNLLLPGPTTQRTAKKKTFLSTFFIYLFLPGFFFLTNLNEITLSKKKKKKWKLKTNNKLDL